MTPRVFALALIVSILITACGIPGKTPVNLNTPNQPSDNQMTYNNYYNNEELYRSKWTPRPLGNALKAPRN